MKKFFVRELDGLHIEAERSDIAGMIIWRGTASHGLVVEEFVAPDKDGAPDPAFYQLNAISRVVNSVAEVWFAMCEIERWGGDAREEMPPEIGRYLDQIEALLSDLFETSPDETDPEYEHPHFARLSEEHAFTLGYLIAEYRWKFQHEKDAMTGKPVRKGAALGGQMSSKLEKRTALYSECRRRVSEGEKIGRVAAGIVSREKLPIVPRSFEQSFNRWRRKKR